MEKRQKLFIILEIFIYLSFIICDCLGIPSTYIRYAGMLICLAYCLSQRDAVFVSAMFFTCLADLFLLVRDDHYELGVASFIIVQLIYCLYLQKNTEIFVRGRIISIIMIVSALLLSGNASFVNILVAIYFPNLLFNLFSCMRDRKLRLLAAGFFLFVCCDICVGLHNILPRGRMYDISSFMMWVFYLPSQVLIALNSRNDA